VKNARDVLKQYWGYDTFRALQAEIIENVLAEKDTLALLPTGGGKSVCFQIPALVRGGLCLVVTPLIALMKDQVEQLNRRGIKALAVFSGMDNKEIDYALDNCAYDKEVRFLYLSPERLKTEMFRARLQKMNISLLAIDEAHCISQWGYDFRPPYMQIAEIRELLPQNVPCIALTASATEKVCADIIGSLKFREGFGFFRKSFARENLWYSTFEETNKVDKMLRILEKVPGSSVVYVRNRARTQQISQILQNHGIKADFYHAGINSDERSAKQEAWIKGNIRVIVATNAFGMGIDKPNVRTVIHLDLPDSMEAYYQEAGRAGRDGEKAYPVLLFEQNDISSLRENVLKSHPTVEKIRECYQALGNYFQLAVGGGEMQAFPFDIDDFSKKFNFLSLHAFNCLKKLEEQGFILLGEALRMPSRFRFLLNNEEIYRFQVANPQLDGFIKMLLRTYGGESFIQYTRIYEARAAKTMNLPVEKLLAGLQYLNELKVLSYIPANEKPQITFLTVRYNANSLPLDWNKLKDRKDNAIEKAEAMIKYATDKEKCRSLIILQNFDEESEEDCGVCDNCLAKKKNKGVSDEKMSEIILAELAKKSYTLPALVARINVAYEKQILELVKNLTEQEKIGRNDEQEFFVQN